MSTRERVLDLIEYVRGRVNSRPAFTAIWFPL